MRAPLAPLLLAIVLAAAPTAPGSDGRSTLDQTIGGGDPAEGFQVLASGPGEAYRVRDELAAPHSGRERRRASLVYFGQISDFQLADEESPARVRLRFRVRSAGKPVKGAVVRFKGRRKRTNAGAWRA